METVLIQINNKKAYKLLENLEDMQIIRVLEKNIKEDLKLSEKYSGKLSPEVTEQFQNYLIQSREEWNERII